MRKKNLSSELLEGNISDKGMEEGHWVQVIVQRISEGVDSRLKTDSYC
jgi:hypothetical protein